MVKKKKVLKKKPCNNNQVSKEKIFRLLENLKEGNTVPVEEFLKSFLQNDNFVPHKVRELAKEYSSKNKVSSTAAERRVIELLKNLKIIYKFQEPVYYGENKSNFYIMDFYIPEKRLCIEIDGEYHFTEEQQIKDLKRTEVIKGKKIKVIRFKNEEVFQKDFEKLLLDTIKPKRIIL